MDQKVDVVLVGPWERVLLERSEKGIYHYISKLRQKNFIGKVIYSSSDPVGIVPIDLFDKVVSTFSGKQIPKSYKNGNTSYSLTKSKLSPYIENVKAGLKHCDSKFIIRVRSDLELRKIESIYLYLKANPEKIYIDYHPEHSLLIPFYFSDMFLAGKAKNIRTLYSGNFQRKYTDKKKISFNPFKHLNAGFWQESYQYPELLFWSNGLYNLGYIKNTSFISSDFVSFIKSIRLINRRITLLDRNKVFVLHSRFNHAHSWGKNILFPWKFSIYLPLIIKHLFQFFYKTIYNLVRKIFNL